MQHDISIAYFWKHITFLFPGGLAPARVTIVTVDGRVTLQLYIAESILPPHNDKPFSAARIPWTTLVLLSDGGSTDNTCKALRKTLMTRTKDKGIWVE